MSSRVVATLAMLACARVRRGGPTTARHPIPARLPASRPARCGSSRTATASTPTYMTTFYEEYPDIDLETASFGSNDEAIAKLQAGFQADVDQQLRRRSDARDGATRVCMRRSTSLVWRTGTTSGPSMKELPGVEVDGKVYIVPVDAGTAGIMYNADVVTDAARLVADLFDPQWAGTGFDGGHLRDRDRHRRAGERDLRSHLTMDRTQLELVKNFLIDHRDQFRTFWKGEADIKSQFKSGEVVIASRLPGDAKRSARRASTCSSRPRRKARCSGRAATASAPMPRTSTPPTRCSTGTRACRRRSTRRREFNYITSNMQGGRPGVAGGDRGLRSRATLPVRTRAERDPGEPARGRERVGRGMDRGEGGLVAQVARPAGLATADRRRPARSASGGRSRRWGWRGVPRVRVPGAVRTRS